MNPISFAICTLSLVADSRAGDGQTVEPRGLRVISRTAYETGLSWRAVHGRACMPVPAAGQRSVDCGGQQPAFR
jgi:hypothetical protein